MAGYLKGPAALSQIGSPTWGGPRGSALGAAATTKKFLVVKEPSYRLCPAQARPNSGGLGRCAAGQTNKLTLSPVLDIKKRFSNFSVTGLQGAMISAKKSG